MRWPGWVCAVDGEQEQEEERSRDTRWERREVPGGLWLPGESPPAPGLGYMWFGVNSCLLLSS